MHKKLFLILLIVAGVISFYQNGYSQNSPPSDGTVNVTIPPYLEYSFTNTDIIFVYSPDGNYPFNDYQDLSIIASTTANCEWIFSIIAEADELVDINNMGGPTISIDEIMIEDDTGPYTRRATNNRELYYKEGDGTGNFNVYWTLDISGLGYIKSGNYKVNTTFSITPK